MLPRCTYPTLIVPSFLFPHFALDHVRLEILTIISSRHLTWGNTLHMELKDFTILNLILFTTKNIVAKSVVYGVLNSISPFRTCTIFFLPTFSYQLLFQNVKSRVKSFPPFFTCKLPVRGTLKRLSRFERHILQIRHSMSTVLHFFSHFCFQFGRTLGLFELPKLFLIWIFYYFLKTFTLQH